MEDTTLARIPRRAPGVEVVDRLPETVSRLGAAQRALDRARRLGAALDRALPRMTSPRRTLAGWTEVLSARLRDASTATRSALRAGQARAALTAHQIQSTLSPARAAAESTPPEPHSALLQRARRLTHRLRDRLELGDPPTPDASRVPPGAPSSQRGAPPSAASTRTEAAPPRATVRSTIAALRARLSGI